jgi:hypothetical protein
MPSITYVMVRSAEGASRTTHGGHAAPGFRFETNSFTRSEAGIHEAMGAGQSLSSGRLKAGPVGRCGKVLWV